MQESAGIGQDGQYPLDEASGMGTELFTMKKHILSMMAAFLAAGSFAHADLQLNAGGVYASGEDSSAYGFELGVGFYFDHSTSSMSSALSLNYLGISDIDTDYEGLDSSAGYDVIALDYRLAFPLMADNVLELYVEGMAGVANTSASLDDWDLSADEWGFAYGFGGGLQWNITKNFGLNVGYTYLGLDEATDDGVALGEDSLNLIRVNATVRF